MHPRPEGQVGLPAVEEWHESRLEIDEITLPQLRGLLRRTLLRSLLASASAGHIVTVFLEEDGECGQRPFGAGCGLHNAEDPDT